MVNFPYGYAGSSFLDDLSRISPKTRPTKELFLKLEWAAQQVQEKKRKVVRLGNSELEQAPFESVSSFIVRVALRRGVPFIEEIPIAGQLAHLTETLFSPAAIRSYYYDLIPYGGIASAEISHRKIYLVGLNYSSSIAEKVEDALAERAKDGRFVLFLESEAYAGEGYMQGLEEPIAYLTVVLLQLHYQLHYSPQDLEEGLMKLPVAVSQSPKVYRIWAKQNMCNGPFFRAWKVLHDQFHRPTSKQFFRGFLKKHKESFRFLVKHLLRRCTKLFSNIDKREFEQWLSAGQKPARALSQMYRWNHLLRNEAFASTLCNRIKKFPLEKVPLVALMAIHHVPGTKGRLTLREEAFNRHREQPLRHGF